MLCNTTCHYKLILKMHSILCPIRSLFSSLRSFLGEGEAIYVDLPGKRASEATVPVSILVTSVRPDMVLIRGLEIILIQLTVPYDSRETSIVRDPGN